MTLKDSLRLGRIGMREAREVYGLTARALRFYEARGLLQAQRDRLNCRWYDSQARMRLAWISDLRKAGVPLVEIEEVLQAEDRGQDGARVAETKLDALHEKLLLQLDRIAACRCHIARASARGRQARRA